MVVWAVLAHTVPFYAVYVLLFADTGLTVGEISTLFLVWSVVGIVAEVPSGALADRFTRRGCLVAAGVLEAAGYLLWTVLPGFPGFAAGFVLWGLGGALVSGAQEALLYDGLAAVGAEEHYAHVQGRVAAVDLVTQIPAAVAATVLLAVGGYGLVGWVSVGVCLAGSVAAARLPEPPRTAPDKSGDGDGGYRAMLRDGLAEAAAQPGVRVAVVAVAVVGGLDALEEYFPLLAQDWGVPVAAVPLAVLPVSLTGAVGAALGGPANRLSPRVLGWLFGAAVVALGAAGIAGHPAGLVGVAVFNGVHQMVLVVVDTRLQQRIAGSARATVTSVASLSTEIVGIGLYAAWALGEVVMVAALGLLVAAALPRWLRVRNA